MVKNPYLEIYNTLLERIDRMGNASQSFFRDKRAAKIEAELSKQPLRLTHHGKPFAVAMSCDDYESIKYLLLRKIDAETVIDKDQDVRILKAVDELAKHAPPEAMAYYDALAQMDEILELIAALDKFVTGLIDDPEVPKRHVQELREVGSALTGVRAYMKQRIELVRTSTTIPAMKMAILRQEHPNFAPAMHQVFTGIVAPGRGGPSAEGDTKDVQG